MILVDHWKILCISKILKCVGCYEIQSQVRSFLFCVLSSYWYIQLCSNLIRPTGLLLVLLQIRREWTAVNFSNMLHIHTCTCHSEIDVALKKTSKCTRKKDSQAPMLSTEESHVTYAIH